MSYWILAAYVVLMGGHSAVGKGISNIFWPVATTLVLGLPLAYRFFAAVDGSPAGRVGLTAASVDLAWMVLGGSAFILVCRCAWAARS